MGMESDREFRMRLEMEYEIIRMPADGNCLFAALATHIYGIPGRQGEVRLQIFQEIVSNIEEYQGFMIQFDNNEQPIETLDNIRQNANWGGELSLGAVTKAYELNVILQQPGQKARNIPAELTYHNTVHLSYHGNNHYNLLRLK